MLAQETLKNWKSLSGFVFNKVSGADKTPLTDEDYDLLDTEGSKLMSQLGFDEIAAKAKKILALNILDKNYDDEFFARVPNIWKYYYAVSMELNSAEYRT